MISVELLCKGCEKDHQVMLEQRPISTECCHCQTEIELDPSQIGEDGQLLRCLVCNNKELYFQKDFNRAFGCAVMVVAIALAVPTYYLSLAVGALIDAAFYFRLPWVLVCYRCRSVYREFDHETHKPYELERAAKYDKYVG